MHRHMLSRKKRPRSAGRSTSAKSWVMPWHTRLSSCAGWIVAKKPASSCGKLYVLDLRSRPSVTILWAMQAAALLYLDLGQVERALELYALGTNHPFMATPRLVYDPSGREIAEAAAAILPAQVAEAAADARPGERPVRYRGGITPGTGSQVRLFSGFEVEIRNYTASPHQNRHFTVNWGNGGVKQPPFRQFSRCFQW